LIPDVASIWRYAARPITYVAASEALILTALIACVTPVLAALRTNPAVVLRQE
jgi:hypothetical protein